MNQWLNRLVALIVALLLGTTLFVAAQNPPPLEVRRPDPSPTATTQPTATPPPLRSAPAVRSDLPFDRRGMLLATQPNGTLRVISSTGDRSWTLDLPQRFSYAAWSPDGLHIVGASADGNAVITHPERQDALVLLSGQRLASTMVSWKDPLTVALAYEDDHAQATVALWSYRNRSLELIGSGRAPAAAYNGPIAWVALDGRSIVLKRDDAAPQILVTGQQLDGLFASPKPTNVEIAQSHGTALTWSPNGSRLAFAAITRREGITFDWTIGIVTQDGMLQHWVIAPDTPVYQLGWLPDGRLLFSDEQGLAAIDPVAGSLKRLLPRYRAARYFALQVAQDRMILSRPTGLFQVPITDLESPQAELERFGPRVDGYQRLDWCCITVPRPNNEP